MYVQVGNDNALSALRGEDDKVEFQDHPGEQVTTLIVTDGIPLNEAFNGVVISMQGHMKEGAKPAWIESDSPGLVTLLEEHYGLPHAQNKRPKAWGEDTGSHLSIISAPENKDLHHMASPGAKTGKE